MKEPTMEEVLELVAFGRGSGGDLYVAQVYGDIEGSVGGSIGGSVRGFVHGDVWRTVKGRINGRKWESIETPMEKAVRLIREERYDEAVYVLERARDDEIAMPSRV